MEHASAWDTELADEDILQRIRDGENELFGTLVRRYERELYGYLRRYVGDAELAADVFQNTFLAIFRKIQQYEPGRAARPWLYTIATNQAIDALRQRARRLDSKADPLISEDSQNESARPWYEVLAAGGPNPGEHAETQELRTMVRNSVNELPPLLRQIVLLTYFQGLKYQDAAEVLGVPLGTVKSRLHVAMTRLTEIWQANHGPQTPVAEAEAKPDPKPEPKPTPPPPAKKPQRNPKARKPV